MRYYISDLHFYHANMNTQMDQRGFASFEEMNEYMIEQWNQKVTSIEAETAVPMGMKPFTDINELLKNIDFEGKSVYVLPYGGSVVPMLWGRDDR